jgi:hypothetical protein
VPFKKHPKRPCRRARAKPQKGRATHELQNAELDFFSLFIGKLNENFSFFLGGRGNHRRGPGAAGRSAGGLGEALKRYWYDLILP